MTSHLVNNPYVITVAATQQDFYFSRRPVASSRESRTIKLAFEFEFEFELDFELKIELDVSKNITMQITNKNDKIKKISRMREQIFI